MARERGKVIVCNGWMYDEKDFPPNECIYVVARSKEAIEEIMTNEEMKEFKYYVYVNSDHFFTEFDMPKFQIMFLGDWQRNQNSRQLDFVMINFAVKHGIKVLQYKGGENGHLLDKGSTDKEMRFHGIANPSSSMDTIKWHPEVIANQPTHLRFGE